MSEANELERLRAERAELIDVLTRLHWLHIGEAHTDPGQPQYDAMALLARLGVSPDREPARAGESAAPAPPQEMTDAEGRLRFLFWRYLNWMERLQVLVRAGACPSTVSQELPQTLESEVLKLARQEGRLGAIWDAMMPMLPENKREPNPFRESAAPANGPCIIECRGRRAGVWDPAWVASTGGIFPVIGDMIPTVFRTRADAEDAIKAATEIPGPPCAFMYRIVPAPQQEAKP